MTFTFLAYWRGRRSKVTRCIDTVVVRYTPWITFTRWVQPSLDMDFGETALSILEVDRETVHGQVRT